MRELKGGPDGPAALPRPCQALPLTVAGVCDRFLAHSQRDNEPGTYAWYRAYLDDLCNHRDDDAGVLGLLPAADLRPFHVTAWLDAHAGWKTGRGCAIRAAKRAFSWAEQEGVLLPNPVKSVKRPAAPSRARTMTREERAELLGAIPDAEFRLFVEAMQESGARPSEIARLAAVDLNLRLGIFVLHRHKTSKRTGKPRVIYMTPRFLEIVTPLLVKYPEGPLFRGPRGGRPFTRQGICSRFRRLREKLPHLKNAIAYAYRHSFATDALTRGVGVAQVAELLGHADTSMVSRHYGHLANQVGHMREAARKATGG